MVKIDADRNSVRIMLEALPRSAIRGRHAFDDPIHARFTDTP